MRGVSIGFRALEYSYMDGGGIRFTETEIYELSLVTIPANAAATIQTIKAMDTGARRQVNYGVPLIQRQAAKVERPADGAVKLLH